MRDSRRVLMVLLATVVLSPVVPVPAQTPARPVKPAAPPATSPTARRAVTARTNVPFIGVWKLNADKSTYEFWRGAPRSFTRTYVHLPAARSS